MSQILIKNANIISMDPTTGDIECGDILIKNDEIVSIGHGLSAANAEVINAKGNIVIPGIVNAHTHTWQTALRGVTSNWTLLEYFKNMHAGLATNFSPDDI